MMKHEELFTVALGELDLYIDFKKGSRFSCPACGENSLPIHDIKEKTWRHLDFFQYEPTFIFAPLGLQAKTTASA